MRRLAVVVHPTRRIDGPLATLREWADARGIDVVQLRTGSDTRAVAEPGEVGGCDLVLALGGDGTVLTALRAAAPAQTPVLGVACGSLGALSAIRAGDLGRALDRIARRDWLPRRLPALEIRSDTGHQDWAVNDLVVARRGSVQLVGDVLVDGELYVRLAGDGVIVATALGSSAYTMAAGGPLLPHGVPAFVCTPLAMHGGNAPPLVLGAASTLTIRVHRGFGGFGIDTDGHSAAVDAGSFDVRLREDQATLVSFGGGDALGLPALRRRRLITDSPRVLARDDRERAARDGAPASPAS